MVSFIGRIVGTTYIVFFPPRRQTLVYSIGGFIHLIGALLIVLAHYLPSSAKFILIVAMALFGVGRSVYMLPFILLSHFFDHRTEQTALTLWFGITALSMVPLYGFIAFLLTKETWHDAYLIVTGLLALTLILNHVGVPEVQGNEEGIKCQ